MSRDRMKEFYPGNSPCRLITGFINRTIAGIADFFLKKGLTGLWS